MSRRFAHISVFALVLVALAPISGTGAQVFGTDVLYTTDADFDEGTLVSVNHDAPNNNQLQLDSPTEPFPFINVAASGRGTVVRVNTETGDIVGEYRTAPEERGLNPSRTTVDLFGNVWTANRDEVDEIDGVPHGSAVKIGLIVGGTRVDASGADDPTGEYLAPPFGYNTCSDRDDDGLIRTSSGLFDVLDWPDLTDGVGGTDGVVQDADDECILVYQRLADAEQARHVSVDADNNVWVGGFPFDLRMFYKLDGTTGAILDSFDANDIGCGGYGGLVDGNGVLWSIGWGWGEGPLMRYDPATGDGTCVNTYGGYGLGIDTNGYVWASILENGIAKVSPSGVLEPGFPKSTWPAPATSTATGAEAWVPMEAPVLTAQPAAMVLQDPATFTFWVAPVDDWVGSMNPWTPGTTVTLTVEDGGGVVYTDSQTADGDGNFHFGLWDIVDLQAGHVVTVSDGTTTKTHTVTGLGLSAVDVTGNTVSGVANDTTDVSVWLHGDGELTVTPASGTWTADFTGTADLTYVSDGGSAQYDGDGDATGVWWTAPRIQVSPDDDWVQASGNWPVGATVDLTIDDGSGSPYTASQAVDEFGRFNFELWETFDVQRGHVVTVSDGTDTKVHTVTNLNVASIDTAGDRILGVASTGMDVDVWAHEGGNLVVTPDGSGNWIADFSGITNITYASDGGSQQTDVDGDSTGDWWSSPRFQVSPNHDWVESSGPWRGGATISLTIDDGGVGYSDSQTADAGGNFHFELGGVFDVQRGHVVTVSDGTTTKTHTVEDLFVDAIDVTADTVSGRADVDSFVHVWVDGYPGFDVQAAGGNWTADFSGITNLDYNSTGAAQQTDAEGDSTIVPWATPKFQASPDHEWVQSDGRWTSGATISLTVEAGGVEVYSDSQTADGDGNFNFGFEDFDLQRGHDVTVSDGTTTKTHTVEDLYADVVNVAADTVSGRADALAFLHVWVDGYPGFDIQANSAGEWTADFSGITDLDYNSSGAAQVADVDGDSTQVHWSSPRFQVAPDDDWVQADGRWTPGATISLTIDDGSGDLYTDTQIADENGWFFFNLLESLNGDLGDPLFDLQRGHVVTVSDGTTTKTHTVIDLYVDGVDVDADTVFGRGADNVDVDVWVHDDEGSQVTTTATADGVWTADFAGITDITYASDGGSQQADDDGDSTGVWWTSPSIQVQPDNDWIGSWNRWPANTPLSLIVDDGDPLNGTLFETAVTTDGNGNFGLELRSEFNVERGHFVTVSDGTTKVHEVFDLYVTEVDVDADIVRGTAQPLSEVEVQVHDEQGAWRLVTADGATGIWEADFSVVTGEGDNTADLGFNSHVSATQYDDDRDVTWVDWQQTMFRVNPDTEEIWGSGWAPNSPATIQVDDDDPLTDPLYEVDAFINEWGDLNLAEWQFDLEPGHRVTVSDGETTKSLVLVDLGEPTINVDADEVSGVAAPGATVEVSVWSFQEGSTRWVVADESTGAWSAGFLTDDQGGPAFDITEQSFVQVTELDDDGDGTFGRFGPPAQWNRGVAVTPIDNHVWVASSGIGAVTRLDNDGNVLKIIPTGDEPTGVAVDAAGKVWVTNQFSDNTVRIDPNADADGLGAIDLTVDLGEGAGPYNYSDMTGAVVVGSTSPQGIWTVIQDSGEAGFEWGRISWNNEPEGSEPEGTAIVVEARTADTEAGLGGAVFQPVVNGELFSSFGRFIEARVTLKASAGGLSPVLSDIRVQPHVIEVGLDIKPGSDPNSINLKRDTGVVPVAVLGSEDFDVAEIDVTTLRFGRDLAEPDHDLLDPVTYADHIEDVNEDGYMDLVSHYRIADIGFQSGDTEACLIGETLSGIPIEGCDAVRIIGKK